MTNHEKTYLQQLVAKANKVIKEVANGKTFAAIFPTPEQKDAFINGLAYGMEPVAQLIDEEIASVIIPGLRSAAQKEKAPVIYKLSAKQVKELTELIHQEPALM